MNETFARSDAPLSPNGYNFALRLPKFMSHLRKNQQLLGHLAVCVILVLLTCRFGLLQECDQQNQLLNFSLITQLVK